MCALDFRLGLDLHFGECADTPKEGVYLCHSVVLSTINGLDLFRNHIYIYPLSYMHIMLFIC